MDQESEQEWAGPGWGRGKLGVGRTGVGIWTGMFEEPGNTSERRVKGKHRLAS